MSILLAWYRHSLGQFTTSWYEIWMVGTRLHAIPVVSQVVEASIGFS